MLGSGEAAGGRPRVAARIARPCGDRAMSSETPALVLGLLPALASSAFDATPGPGRWSTLIGRLQGGCNELRGARAHLVNAKTANRTLTPAGVRFRTVDMPNTLSRARQPS